MIKFAILNRFSGNVQFTAEIDCAESASKSLKIGLAVRWGIANDADLRDANLSGANMRDANLRGADLRGANLIDADLRDANLIDADLSGADLRDANLIDADLYRANLIDADLHRANLSGANMRDANLRGADLRGANLSGANLSGANMRDANLIDAPFKIEGIHSKVYEAAAQPGALDMSTWHCGTTHCRAGWVVELAGGAGKALEWAMGTPAAAAMIYLASDPKIEKMPDFYCDNATALADMKRLADAEVAA